MRVGEMNRGVSCFEECFVSFGAFGMTVQFHYVRSYKEVHFVIVNSHLSPKGDAEFFTDLGKHPFEFR